MFLGYDVAISSSETSPCCNSIISIPKSCAAFRNNLELPLLIKPVSFAFEIFKIIFIIPYKINWGKKLFFIISLILIECWNEFLVVIGGLKFHFFRFYLKI